MKVQIVVEVLLAKTAVVVIAVGEAAAVTTEALVKEADVFNRIV